jgi:hypothetical protein
MVDEASAVHKGLLYQEVFPRDKSWYSANAQTEMADLVVMVRLLCKQKGWDFVELERLGRQRFETRMKELKNGRQD